MVPRHIQTLLQRSKTTTHLLQLRSLILKTSLDCDEYVVSLFTLSACSVCTDIARLVFDDFPICPPLFAWNTIIRAYARCKNPVESVELFAQLQETGLRPDHFTYPFVLKSCGACSMLSEGSAVHSLIIKEGFDLDKYIVNTLLRMYSACGFIPLARKVFDEMPERDVVSWSAMIAGYVSCNCPSDALLVFQHMKVANVKPNAVTLVSLLSACSQLFNISIGKSVHQWTIVNNVELDVALGTAIVEMYSRCGHIEKALQVFNAMSESNLQSWTVMISGLADHGQGKDAIYMFNQMVESGLRPDSLSFSAVLSACSHLGLVEEGRRFFYHMARAYDVKPTVEHYGCIVDLLGRAGLVEEAYQIIRDMPIVPSSVILRSFLGACRNHGRVVEVDDNVGRLLLQVEPHQGANYVLASNANSLHGCWNDAANLRKSMKEKGIKKVPGCSWVVTDAGRVN